MSATPDFHPSPRPTDILPSPSFRCPTPYSGKQAFHRVLRKRLEQPGSRPYYPNRRSKSSSPLFASASAPDKATPPHVRRGAKIRIFPVMHPLSHLFRAALLAPSCQTKYLRDARSASRIGPSGSIPLTSQSSRRAPAPKSGSSASPSPVPPVLPRATDLRERPIARFPKSKLLAPARLRSLRSPRRTHPAAPSRFPCSQVKSPG